jgi:cytochrome c oxidase subunit IV
MTIETMLRRSLYNKDYLQSDCTTAYNEESKVDNLFWTYCTNFVLAAVCLLIALYFISKQGRWSLILFYLLVAVGNLISGFSHALIDHQVDGTRQTPFVITFILITLAHGFLLQTGLCTYTRVSKLWHAVLAVITLGVLALAFALWDLRVVGVFSLVTYLVIIYVVYPKWIQCAAMILGILALLVQVSLAGNCGDDGYEECFRSCPLPNPDKFNHNALFHVIWAVSLYTLFAGERSDPKLAYPKESER